MALRLRRESIMTLKWMAQRRHMGSWTQVSTPPIDSPPGGV
jgi:hypothetical protein